MIKAKTIKQCVVIGSSTGLGASLVEECLNETSYYIIGVARTSFEKIDNYQKWQTSKRYSHIEIDITSQDCINRLKTLCSSFQNEPICVIFNAAIVQADIEENGSIDYDLIARINHVGIDGFSNILASFGDYFAKHGGVFIGVSSFSAFVPPFLEPRIAYPASKAYLDMALRSLRMLWDKKVSVVTVHLGHLGNPREKIVKGQATNYANAAKIIVNSLFSKKIPQEINYPILYCVVYKYIFKFISDSLYFELSKIFRHFIKN